MTLTENQLRHVANTLTHVDHLLDDIERLAVASHSPFAAQVGDLSPDEQRLILASVEQFRDHMLTALDRLGIPHPAPSLSARWGIETTLQFADIALTDLNPRELRGYGELDAEGEAMVDAVVADLRTTVRHTRALLHEHDAGGTADLLEHVPGPAGEVLRRLSEISEAHGIAQARPLIAAAAERATTLTFDVGVFGRVSAGKSSLINALLDVAVLPVGATPVTAVALRVSAGESAITVHFLTGPDRTLPLEELPAYATEAGNARNHLGVRSVDIRAPGVPHGVRFLDTPGVGSLSSSGSAQAFAWLPRCDLGLVLVAAGTPVSHEELALVSALTRAGIECRVLVSKADLLAPSERAAALEYVTREVASALGSATPAQAISTRPGAVEGLDVLRHEVILPRASRRAVEARAALRRRIEHLIILVQEAIQGSPATHPTPPSADVDAARLNCNIVLQREMHRLSSATDAILAAAATALHDAWIEHHDPRAVVRAAILRAATDAVGEMTVALDQLREVAGHDAEEGRRIPPVFDPEFLGSLPEFPAPRLPGFRGTSRANAQLAPLRNELGAALSRYSSRLHAWGTAAIDAAIDDTSRVDRSPTSFDAELEPLMRLAADIDRG